MQLQQELSDPESSEAFHKHKCFYDEEQVIDLERRIFYDFAVAKCPYRQTPEKHLHLDTAAYQILPRKNPLSVDDCVKMALGFDIGSCLANRKVHTDAFSFIPKRVFTLVTGKPTEKGQSKYELFVEGESSVVENGKQTIWLHCCLYAYYCRTLRGYCPPQYEEMVREQLKLLETHLLETASNPFVVPAVPVLR